MKWSMPLGRVAGIPIRIHATFLLLLAWIAWLGWESGGLSASLWGLVLVNCLFACIVLHELSHSLVAMRFGAEVRSVTLWPVGGVASMRGIPERPHQELLVALAGPATNLLIFAVLALLRGSVPPWFELRGFPSNIMELRDDLIRANVFIAVFNLIPAFPMDGGRVLRSLLGLLLPHAAATAVAATIGQLLATGFVVLGLMAGHPVLVVIGVFVFLGAESEERAARVKGLLRDVLAEDVMATDFVRLAPEDTLSRCLEHVFHRRQEDFPVEADGRLVGVLPRRDWLAALHRDGAGARVGEVMLRDFVCVHPKTPLARIYQDLWGLKQGVFPVMDQGRLCGLLTAEDISRYVMVEEARRQSPRAVRDVPPPSRRGASRFAVDLG